jgi:hypothetical protein
MPPYRNRHQFPPASPRNGSGKKGRKSRQSAQKCSGPGATAESLREEFTIDTARDADHDQSGVGWILSADSLER